MIKRRKITLEIKRWEELASNFAKYVGHFETLRDLFSGPSIYFHQKLIKRLVNEGLVSVVSDQSFHEGLYATLTAWGMHRMGKTMTRLRPFADFSRSIYEHAEKIVNLADKRISDLFGKRECPMQGGSPRFLSSSGQW